MAIFEIEKLAIEKKIWTGRISTGMLGVCAVVSTFGLLFNPRLLDKETKTLVNLLGIVSSVGLHVSIKLRDRGEKIYKSYGEAQLAVYRNDCKHEVAYAQVVSNINAKINAAEWVGRLPRYQQPRFIAEYQLQGILPPEKQVQPEVINTEAEAEITIPGKVTSAQLKTVESKTEIDLSWLTSDFIRYSKVVVGVRGSGKSSYLKYEASRFLLENPNSLLYIFDPHFNKQKPERWWLNNIPLDILLERFVTKKAEDIYQKVVGLYRELQRRIDEELEPPEVPKVKIILDEEENLKRSLDEEKFDYFLKFVSLIQDEGRKFGFEITIGMHGLKKHKTGIDSNDLGQMNWLVFEKSAYDPNTRYPADFETDQIKKSAKYLHDTFSKNSGRLVVVLDQEKTSSLVTVLPFLPPPIINLVSEEEKESTPSPTDEMTQDAVNYLEQLKLVLAELEEPADDLMLTYLWKQITGVELTEKGLQYLKEQLNK